MRQNTSVRLALRFLWVVFLAMWGVAFFDRVFVDEPPYGPPPEMRGTVYWSVIILIALWDQIRVRRRLDRFDPFDPYA